MKNFFKALAIFLGWALIGLFILNETDSLAGQKPVVLKSKKNKPSSTDGDNTLVRPVTETEETISPSENDIVITENTGVYADSSLTSDSSRLIEKLSSDMAQHERQIAREKSRPRPQQKTPQTFNPQQPVSKSASIAHTLEMVIYPVFSSGEVKLDENMLAFTANLRKILKERPDAKITIIGHTDSVGNAVDNYLIALERARQIKWYLSNRLNVAESQIEAVSKGETEPLFSNENPESRSKNNRIEVKIK